MKLLKFRVENFRSVHDSEWIGTEDVTALIGVIESGKTNLLLPLWKLNPVGEREIQPNSDYPVTLFTDIINDPKAYRFVTAEFDSTDISDSLSDLTTLPTENLRRVQDSRYYDERYEIVFPDSEAPEFLDSREVVEILTQASNTISKLTTYKQESELKPKLLSAFKQLCQDLSDECKIILQAVSEIIAKIEGVLPKKPAKTSSIVREVRSLVGLLRGKFMSF